MKTLFAINLLGCLCPAAFGQGIENVKVIDRWKTGSYMSLAYSHVSGQLAAGGGNDIQFWDPKTGRKLEQFGGNRSIGGSVVFSLDGKKTASTKCTQYSDSVSGELHLWDNASKVKPEIRMSYPTARLSNVVFAGDGRHMLVGVNDNYGQSDLSRNYLEVVDLVAKKVERRMRWKSSYIMTLGSSVEKKRLAVGGYSTANNKETGMVHLLDYPDLRIRSVHKPDLEIVRSVEFSPDEKTLAIGGDGKHIHLIDPASGALRLVLRNAPRHLTSLSFSRDGRLLAAAGADDGLFIWSTKDGRRIHQHEDKEPVWAVAFLSNDLLAYSGGGERDGIIATVRIESRDKQK